jgi:predicted SAM-dependent methyltransferase
MSIKLNLGCGKDYVESWTNIDIVDGFKKDLTHDLSLPLPFEKNTVDQIKAKDILEHFNKYQIPKIFAG